MQYVDFDVELKRIFTKSKSQKKWNDITINWTFLDIDNRGIFYTDANSYKMVKRNSSHDVSKTNIASYFYPVDAAIYIQDEPQGKEQFAIMSDRVMAGSGYKSGRIELVINR